MERIVCNKCGRMLKMEKGISCEDFIRIQKTWGYFSKKDGKIQEFVICEACVEELEKEFAVPSHFCDVTEWL